MVAIVYLDPQDYVANLYIQGVCPDTQRLPPRGTQSGSPFREVHHPQQWRLDDLLDTFRVSKQLQGDCSEKGPEEPDIYSATLLVIRHWPCVIYWTFAGWACKKEGFGVFLTYAQSMVCVRNVTNKDIRSWWGVLGQLLDAGCRAMIVISEN
jgi:hypothetical protein